MKKKNHYPQHRIRTGLVSMTLVAPSHQAILSAREHLKFWTFVKEFHELSETKMQVTVFIGKGLCPRDWANACQRGQEVINLCLQHYNVHFIANTQEILSFRPKIGPTSFIRPDDMLESMFNLIKD